MTQEQMMSEPKRTPGPWVANRFENGELFVAADGLTVCKVTKCVGMTGVITQAEAEENARLIAAAPELLAALQQASDYIAASAPTVAESLANPDTGLIDSGEGLLTMGVVYELIAQIEATIAKATGQPT